MLPKLIPIAKEHGYCFELHGSLATDLDAVCVPWVEDASEEEVLVEALKNCIGGFVVSDEKQIKRLDSKWGYTLNPHNRHTYTISFGGSMYMDITIMPKYKTTMTPSKQSLELAEKIGDLLEQTQELCIYPDQISAIALLIHEAMKERDELLRRAKECLRPSDSALYDKIDAQLEKAGVL